MNNLDFKIHRLLSSLNLNELDRLQEILPHFVQEDNFWTKDKSGWIFKFKDKVLIRVQKGLDKDEHLMAGSFWLWEIYPKNEKITLNMGINDCRSPLEAKKKSLEKLISSIEKD